MNKVNGKEKHVTASIFIFHKFQDAWRVLFIHHKKFDRWMIPGGHAETTENPVEAVLREAHEETSLSPRLVSFLHRKFQETDSQWLLPPEYLFEQRIPSHKGDAEHFHLDCAYVAIAHDDKIQHRIEESNDIRWFTEDEVEKEVSMFLSTQKIALELFGKLKIGNIEDIATFI